MGWWWLHACLANAEFSQSPHSMALRYSFTVSLGTSLCGLRKWLGNQHMGFSTPLLTSLLWGHGLLVASVAVWEWCTCSGGRRPSTAMKWGLTTLPPINHAHREGWPLDLETGLQWAWQRFGSQGAATSLYDTRCWWGPVWRPLH